MSQTPIFVVKPSLPAFEEFSAEAKKIWETRILTNSGPLHQTLEKKLCEVLDVPHISLFNNATIALLVAMRVLDLEREVITTPFSFIATAHAVLWGNLTPVFVDVEPQTLNIDPARIEAAITPRTSAILAVHCYGNPCDVDAIEAIARKHNLKVVYDAAHAFGVSCHCGSVLKHGDLSVLSFHATKVFNTFEGGAIVCQTPEMKARIDRFKNFGIVDELHVEETGLNGKMSEVNAALGLAQLPHMQEYLSGRARVDTLYRKELAGVRGIQCLPTAWQKQSNYAYFPVLVQAEFKMSRDALHETLKVKGIMTRRYFYPLISTFPMYREFASAAPNNLPVATQAGDQVLCLPIYPDLSETDQMRVIQAIKEAA